jgi:hypothetical protein
MEASVVVRLELDEREAELLREVCEQTLSELRAEIVRTESTDFRRGLKAREGVLRSLLSRLSSVA